ncbi:PREDICTED: translation initiation factor eIF-2B subunit gamma isoform X2 [Eufriesea mexicana]|uniref:translation initiation factor eIF-2B subunit gamma isoform X2 n=1 Tax=Eufriesea mexicana TaxID=516756 RepID=UPI00083BE0F2|nr:PREDICTED: translation initiation factor eIF-2B subunit gamma isoform X2 [Eufriesea mexicana]
MKILMVKRQRIHSVKRMFPYKEFQAVVLAAGFGSRMTELTRGEYKCLLPIGNIPMLWYPLQLLERAGFKEAIVIISEYMERVSLILNDLNLKIKMDFVVIENAENIGTADSIRLIHEKIHTDFLVIPCDLITDVDICEILNLYRKHNASITALMLPVPKVPNDIITPGPKNKQKPDTDLIGINNETGRLIFFASASDFEETIKISQTLLKKHPSFTIHSKLMDSHLYVINKWVLDFLVHNKNFTTLKGELLPYIVSKQFSKPPKQCVDDKSTSIVQMNLKKDIYSFSTEKPLNELIRKMSAFNDHDTDLEDAYYGDIIRCYAYIDNGKFGLRANTIQMYHFANTKVGMRKVTATLRSTQMENCRVDHNAVIDEKTSLKNTHIGPNVAVESTARISQSVLMEAVTVRQRCIIHNCILCNGSFIEENTELRNCIVGPMHVVESGSQYSHEVIMDPTDLVLI